MSKWRFKASIGVGEKSVAAIRVSFAVIGLILLWVGANLVGTAWRGASWPAVEGEVARVEAARRVLSSGASGAAHYPSVVYRYAVDGRVYEGSAYRFGSEALAERSFPSAGEAVAYGQENYKIGQALEVYVDPADPSRAVRARSGLLVSSLPLLLGFGALFTAFYARDALAIFRDG